MCVQLKIQNSKFDNKRQVRMCILVLTYSRSNKPGHFHLFFLGRIVPCLLHEARVELLALLRREEYNGVVWLRWVSIKC